MEVVFKVIFFIIIMPIIVFQEGSKLLTDTLKKKKIYEHWDIWHSLLLFLIIILIIMWLYGF